MGDDAAEQALVQQIAAGIRGYVDEFSVPLVNAVRTGARRPAETAGKLRVDALRTQFARFDATEQRRADRRRTASDDAAVRAVTVGVVVLVLVVALLFAFAAYVGRWVAVPIRRVAAAADRLATGDLAVRVPVRGQDEVAQLAGSFNAMGDALQDSHDELDSQQSELEIQTAELEDQQQQLSTANDELRAQRDELEHITASLAGETERQRLFGDFADALAVGAALPERSMTTLRVMAEAADAQVGALYVADAAQEGAYELVGTLGLDAAALPGHVRDGDGLAGRALTERRCVQTGHDAATLRVMAFGREVAVRQEVHVPLVYGERLVGVASLGRTAAGTVDERACERLSDLAAMAAVSIANALVTTRAQGLAGINRAVLDTVRDGILMTNDRGVVVLANPRAHEFTEAILGVTIAEAEPLEPTDIAARFADAEGFLAAADAIAANPDEARVDELEVTETGRVFERYSAPVYGEGGERLGRTTVIREVTAEREAENLKNELMATVSHELRTPLASIVGFTELMLVREPEPEERRSHLQIVHREAQRLAELIDDFLDLQLIGESGRLPLSRRPVDLRPLVSDQARVFTAQSGAHTLDVRLPEAPLVTEADPSRLKQVVANLLSNAIKYSPEGGEIGVEGWVRDDVVGIARERQRPRHSARATAAGLRALLPRPGGDGARDRRHRPRARPLARDRRGPPGPDGLRERRRPRLAVLVRAAGRRRPGGRTERDGRRRSVGSGPWSFRPGRAPQPRGRRWRGWRARRRSCGARTSASATRSRSGPTGPRSRWSSFSHPDAVRDVFRLDPAIAPAGESWEFLRPFAGEHSILLLDGDEHLRERRLMNAPFHGERMRALGPVIADLARAELATWRGRVVTLERMRRLTLEIILRVVLGARGREAADLRAAVDATLDRVRSMPRMLAMALVQRDLGPRSPWGQFRRAVERFDALLLAVIARRRADPGDDSVLSFLLEQRDEDGRPPDDRHLRDQLVALLVGGHDSSASALAWAFERLARHPAVQARLRDGDPAYLDAVVKEVLRIRPSLTIAPRRLLAPVEIAGRRLPAGVQVAACIWLANRREDLWPQAGAFRPERWLGTEPKPNPLSWIPFGGGVRRCTGAPFAEMEMREVLRAAADLQLRPVRPEPERARRSMLVVVPARGGEVLVG